jgi:hypothetical protein
MRPSVAARPIRVALSRGRATVTASDRSGSHLIIALAGLCLAAFIKLVSSTLWVSWMPLGVPTAQELLQPLHHESVCRHQPPLSVDEETQRMTLGPGRSSQDRISSHLAITPQAKLPSNTAHDRWGPTQSRRADGPEEANASLLVLLRRDAHRCVASFSGALTDTTRTTIQALAQLMIGERSIVLDFSRVDQIDRDGAEAVQVLVHSVKAGGAQLRMTQPKAKLHGISWGPTRPSLGGYTSVQSPQEGR